jgi:cytosine/uracil/thiamine/allantoin permease
VHQLDPAKVPAGLVSLFDYAWFIGFALAFVIYLVLRKLAPKL